MSSPKVKCTGISGLFQFKIDDSGETILLNVHYILVPSHIAREQEQKSAIAPISCLWASHRHMASHCESRMVDQIHLGPDPAGV